MNDQKDTDNKGGVTTPVGDIPVVDDAVMFPDDDIDLDIPILMDIFDPEVDRYEGTPKHRPSADD